MLTLHPDQIYMTMKKILIIITAVLLPVLAQAQAQINTKKVKIGDFTEKVTKVVLSGNQFIDGILQDEIAARWRISPYEFCTHQEFEDLKTSSDYYFLMTTTGQFRKESGPSIQYLTIVKGGPEAEIGLDKMLEVVSMPIASAQFPSGRELVFLPAMLDIIQDYTMDSMDEDTKAYGGLGVYASRIMKNNNFNIVFAEDDLASSVDETVRNKYFNGNITSADVDDSDKFLKENAESTLVSYTVAPFDPQPGSFCYKMLIDTQNYRLYYFKKDKISKKKGAGFSAADLKKICPAKKTK